MFQCKFVTNTYFLTLVVNPFTPQLFFQTRIESRLCGAMAKESFHPFSNGLNHSFLGLVPSSICKRPDTAVQAVYRIAGIQQPALMTPLVDEVTSKNILKRDSHESIVNFPQLTLTNRKGHVPRHSPMPHLRRKD